MKNRFLNKLSFLLLCNLSFLSACHVVPQPSATLAAEGNSASPLGVNLEGITYYSGGSPFLNNFKNAAPWRTVCNRTDPGCPTNPSTKEEHLLQLDANGWVKSLPSPQDAPLYTKVSTYLFFGAKDRYPSGQYIVSYKGEGKLTYGGDAKLIQSQPGRDVLELNSALGKGVWIDLVSTDPRKNGNYLRDIVVVKAEDESKVGTQVFQPKFLNSLKSFKSLRFMDWMNTNHSQQRTWQGRPLPQGATYSKAGAPVETMVSLSNQVNASPWFNIPHMADNNYVTSFAKLVKKDLKPGLKVYVEYSNEVWNVSFPQGKWVEQQAVKLWPSPQYPQGGWIKRLNWHGKRTAEVCQIWKTVFADRPQSVVCVMGSQGGYNVSSIQSLDCPLWSKGPCYKYKIDGLAIGSYFGSYIGLSSNESNVANWSLDRLFQEINGGRQVTNSPGGGSIEGAKSQTQQNYQIARQRNLMLFAYEGGQHLAGVGPVANNQSITNLFVSANRDPRMGQVYTNHLNNWKNNGGSLFMHFSNVGPASKFGSWGLLEYGDQETSPKYEAVNNFIQNNPCWWSGCQQ
jgi:hypothetical protein